MSLRRFLIGAAVVVGTCAPAAAQGVKLEFHEGRVTLSAQNVPLRTILNEWARLGGTKIVNGDRVPGGLVTLELNGVPERQALDTLLRSASGYLAGPRQGGAPTQSAFASILILPTSSAAPPPAPMPTAGPRPPAFFPGAQPPTPFPTAQRGVPIPQVVPPSDPDDDPAGDVPPADDPDETPNPRARVRPGVRGGQPAQPLPPGDEQPQTATPPSANNPFGAITGSSQPGVISPVPQPQQQRPRSQPDPEP